VTIAVTQGDCVEVLRARAGPLFDSCVCDPPYELGFMGRAWDRSGVAFQVETWRAVFDQLKPGAHLVAFSGTRTYHRMAVAIEDAGFEVRDQLAWIYGSGFPKSLDVSKAIDKAAGAERDKTAFVANNVNEWGNRGNNPRCNECGKKWGSGDPCRCPRDSGPATAEAAEWQGWGTALKPAWEPICLARKPLIGTVTANVLAHGTGGLNVDACRVEASADDVNRRDNASLDRGGGIGGNGIYVGDGGARVERPPTLQTGRFPANLIHDGSDEVVGMFPDTQNGGGNANSGAVEGMFGSRTPPVNGSSFVGDNGSAARFFYSAKAGPLDRLGSEHTTVKPVDVMRWLERMTTPPGGLILDPFAGSGTTAIAAMAEGFNAELIELLPEHVADIERKLAHLRGEGRRVMDDHKKRKAASAKVMPLFGGLL
jgi:DNA modification methylase